MADEGPQLPLQDAPAAPVTQDGPTKTSPKPSSRAGIVLVIVVVFIAGYGCGRLSNGGSLSGPDVPSIENSIQADLTEKVKSLGITCSKVSLLHETGNKYSGLAELSDGSKETLDITIDGDKYLWSGTHHQLPVATSSPAQTAAPDDTGTPPGTQVEAPEVLQAIDAVEMCSAYFANALAGDQQYKGKRLLITGNVQEVRRDTIDNTYFVDISGGEGNRLVRCYLRDEAEIRKAASLVKDAKVQVAGTVAEGDTDTMHALVTVQDAVIKVP